MWLVQIRGALVVTSEPAAHIHLVPDEVDETRGPLGTWRSAA